VKGKTIAGWTIEDEDMIKDIKLGTTEDPKMVRIGKELDPTYENQVIEILRNYKDVFAWTYENKKGIPPHNCEHKIELKPNTKPIKQSRYQMNPNYAAKVKEEIDKLLKAGFIYPVDRAEWLSPIVIVPKKNGKLRVCVDYRKLNGLTKFDPFPLPFTEEILETVAGYEMLSLLDGLSGYNQVKIAPEDQPKACFITEWGACAIRMMSFGLMSAIHFPKGSNDDLCRVSK
jgi:hypothetical protein